ncbi:MAG TPA: hypothetical protein VJY33_05830 [Isosphaeraceae bacterium]|nr:hypothetical protein [Isosphaeraceae bacterium]
MEGPAAAIPIIEILADEPALQHYHLINASLGELYRRSGNLDRARFYFERARNGTTSRHEQELLDRRLAGCVAVPST